MKVFKKIMLPNGESVQLTLQEFKGKNYFNLRVWYQDGRTGEWRPSQKGVTILIDLLPEILDGLLAIEEEAAKTGIMEEESRRHARTA